MKILHVTESDSNGAGIAALRIVLAQRKQGLDSKLIVRDKSSKHVFVYQFYYFKFLDYALNILAKLIGLNNIFSFNALAIVHSRLFKESDVIHIHNIHYNRMLHPLMLPRKKFYAYTLHDMWAITGNCNYTYDLCERYTIGCGKCPLNSDKRDWGFPKMWLDLTALQAKIKKAAYDKLRIIFISPSRWLQSKAQNSLLTKHKEIICIPNCIELAPVTSRTFSETPRLLFVGQKSRASARKGFSYVAEAINLLGFNCELHIVGLMPKGYESQITNKNCKIVFHGAVQEEKMKNIYRNSELLILPSRYDNFPNAILESFAQGTPVVSFNIGGIPELVNSNTGYLANYQDSADLALGISKTLTNLKEISENVLEAVQCYSFELSAERHLKVYEKLMGVNK